MWLEAQGSTTTAVYTYGNALIRKDGQVPLFDGLGSERTVTNASQTVTGTITFEGFGQTVATTGSSTNPYMFAATHGYRTDGDAGLMHVGARYYDPQVGRLITRDTVLTEHPYLYCDHDPVNAVDPTGHSKLWDIIRGLILLFGGQHEPEPEPPRIPPPPPPATVGSPPPGWDPNPPLPGGARIIDPPDPGPWVKSSPGSGGAVGGIITIGVGAGAFGDGMDVVVKYRRKIESYLDPDGNWQP